MKRVYLTEQTIRDIFLFSGTPEELRSTFGVPVSVARNIKHRHTYKKATADLQMPGELRLYKLTWDEVCEIRASPDVAQEIADRYRITRETVYNIRSGKTRILK